MASVGDERDELDRLIDETEQHHDSMIRHGLNALPSDVRDMADSIASQGLEQCAAARSIRARERKLAELAHEIARMRTDETTYPKMKDWIRRYEEALK